MSIGGDAFLCSPSLLVANGWPLPKAWGGVGREGEVGSNVTLGFAAPVWGWSDDAALLLTRGLHEDEQ